MQVPSRSLTWTCPTIWRVEPLFARSLSLKIKKRRQDWRLFPVWSSARALCWRALAWDVWQSMASWSQFVLENYDLPPDLWLSRLRRLVARLTPGLQSLVACRSLPAQRLQPCCQFSCPLCCSLHFTVFQGPWGPRHFACRFCSSFRV